MSKQFIFTQDCLEGSTIDYTAVADISVGDVVPLGTTAIGIAKTNITTGDTGALATAGQGDVVAETGVAWAIGDIVYWDDTANKGTKTATGNARLGTAIATKASAAAVGRIALNYTF
ncbi:DUF2190 family protein [Sporomusa sphaeroides DSM 2875]|uniref:DUF2190 family protein n=1 Tax=Sporomusa sphaeroides TaxID=47679 RepID=UPI0020300031|nr:DUF2190 family protein [Sporomusa sphaeroides]MCM0759602.1 DUF2190 family protein [Sporomusa sphaeroides DSM 2875]